MQTHNENKQGLGTRGRGPAREEEAGTCSRKPQGLAGPTPEGSGSWCWCWSLRAQAEQGMGERGSLRQTPLRTCSQSHVLFGVETRPFPLPGMGGRVQCL